MDASSSDASPGSPPIETAPRRRLKRGSTLAGPGVFGSTNSVRSDDELDDELPMAPSASSGLLFAPTPSTQSSSAFGSKLDPLAFGAQLSFRNSKNKPQKTKTRLLGIAGALGNAPAVSTEVSETEFFLPQARDRSRPPSANARRGSKDQDDKDSSMQEQQYVVFLPKHEEIQSVFLIQKREWSFLDDHPALRDVSMELKHELAHLVQRRRLAGAPIGSEGAAAAFGTDHSGVLSGSALDLRDTSQIRNLVTQDIDPPSEFDGLLFTDARFDADLELVNNNFTIASFSTNAMVNAEAVLGVTAKPAFGIRLRSKPSEPVYFLPREEVQAVLAKPAFAADKAKLFEVAAAAADDMLGKWVRNNVGRVKVRLFANVSAAFKNKLIQAMTIRLYCAGATILREGDAASSCILVSQGEADASVDGHHVAQLTNHGQHSSAWSGWWSLLEATGASARRPSNVFAVTDCVVWFLEGSVLKSLRAEFPLQCGFFDKVVVKHVKLLSQYAMDFFHVPLLKECSQDFLANLSCICTQRVLMPGDYIVREDDHGTEMFLLSRGQAGVFKGEVWVARQIEGACFGELAVLGITSKRTASIICDTVCDLRVLDRQHLLKALTHFPKDSSVLEGVAEAHGYSRKLAIEELENLETLQGFSREFVKELIACMHAQAFFLGQTCVKQDEESYEMYIVTTGTLSLEVSGVQCAEVVGPDLVCETALMKPGSRAQATIRCVSLCECYAIYTKQVADRFQQKYPADMAKLAVMAQARMDVMAKGLLEKFDELHAERDEEGNLIMGSENPESADKPKGSAPPKLGKPGTFFADSNSAFLEQLSQQLERRIYFDGQTMLQHGEAGDYALLINDGTGVVEVGGQRVAEIKRGDFVGEVVLLGFAETYSCTIKAMGLVTAWFVRKKEFAGVIEKFPDEKKRLEDLMKKRVNLTRCVTKMRAFCKFVPGKDGEQVEEEPHEHGKHAAVYRAMSTVGGVMIGHGTSHHRGSTGHRGTTTHGGEYGGRRNSLELLLSCVKEPAAPVGLGGLSAITPRGGHARMTLSPSPQPGAQHVSDQRRGTLQHDDSKIAAEGTHDMAHKHATISDAPTTVESGHGNRSFVAAHANEHNEDMEGFSDESDNSSCDEHPKGPSKRVVQSAKAQGKAWVIKRKQAIKKASWRRNMNLKKTGRLAEALPPDCSFGHVVPEAPTSPYPNSKQGGSASARAANMRFRKANYVYGRPVWHEVFGAKEEAALRLPPIAGGYASIASDS